jgi:multiple sugar transport system permease protein
MSVAVAQTKDSVRRSFLSPRRIGRIWLYVVATSGAIVFAFPFVWMITTSLKPGTEIMVMPPVLIPSHFEWTNYTRPFQTLPFPLFFRNTATVTILGMTGVLISSSICAFAFARMRFPFRDTFFVAMLATLMLPYPVTMIPTYVLFTKLGLINTFAPLIVPEWLGSPFIIFLLRQYMMTIPIEMDDAARIDGCGWLGLYWRIIIPLATPALGVAAIYSFTFHWNDFVRPVIFLNQIDLFTVPLGLALLNSRYATDFGGMMAIATLSLIPVLVVFFTAQRNFMQGIVVSGVKG